MIVICDLDGTLSDASHRQHLVQGPNKDFTKFYDLAYLDAPKHNTIQIVNHLKEAGNSVYILSGRTDRVREDTLSWLDTHDVLYNALHMRREGDYTPDDELKQFMLRNIQDLYQFTDQDILCCIDDRDRVVNMWRSLGLLCLQVAPGDF